MPTESVVAASRRSSSSRNSPAKPPRPPMTRSPRVDSTARADALHDVVGLCKRHARLLVACGHVSTSAASSGRPSGPPGRNRTIVSPIATSEPNGSTSRISAIARALSCGSSARRWSSLSLRSSACSSAVLDPVARRVNLEPVAGLGGDERPFARVVLNLQLELDRALERRGVPVLVECDPEMIDAGPVPMAGLDHNVDRPAAELDQPEPESLRVEVVPGDTGLEPVRVLADPAVAADEREAELADVARLDQPDFARDQVVVEKLHRARPS